MNCSNCGKELRNVYASRSVELELQSTNRYSEWVEKTIFSSTVSCPNCHEVLSDETITELGIMGY
jgi:ribosomal protein L34E